MDTADWEVLATAEGVELPGREAVLLAYPRTIHSVCLSVELLLPALRAGTVPSCGAEDCALKSVLHLSIAGSLVRLSLRRLGQAPRPERRRNRSLSSGRNAHNPSAGLRRGPGGCLMTGLKCPVVGG